MLTKKFSGIHNITHFYKGNNQEVMTHPLVSGHLQLLQHSLDVRFGKMLGLGSDKIVCRLESAGGNHDFVVVVFSSYTS